MIKQNQSVATVKHKEKPEWFIEHEGLDMQEFQKINDKINTSIEQNILLLERSKKIEEFMENMSGINDISQGISLLKRPALWILAFVIGVVALIGGAKTLLGWFFIMK